MPISKKDVRKALGALEAVSPDIAKGGAKLNSAEGAAQEGGGDGKLRAPGKSMTKVVGGAKKSLVVKAEPPKEDDGDEEEEEEEEDEDDDKDSDGGGDDKAPPPAPAIAKSVPPAFRESMPAEIQTKVDVSNFLRSLVDHTAVTVDGLRDALMKSDMANENRIDAVVDAVEGIQKSMGNIGVVLTAICERIGVIENQPAAPARSVVKSGAAPVAGGKATERTFEGGEPAADGGGFYKSLVGKPAHIAKAMVSEAICDLVKKGQAADLDVINFESTGFVPPELAVKLNSALN
jgi:Sec-independent protein translocase protein TatA